MIWAGSTFSLLCSVAALEQSVVPFVAQPLSPEAAAPGSPSFTLTINGSGFNSTPRVTWNGSVRATHFVTNNQLTASILAFDVAAAGTATVAVVNNGIAGQTSNLVSFDIITSVSSVTFAKKSQRVAAVGSTAVADLNGDGNLDLVLTSGVTGQLSNHVAVWLGNPDGTFRQGSTSVAGKSPGFVAVGDFNGDGKPDLAVSDVSSTFVSIFLGNGDGTFGPRTDFAVGPTPQQIAVGDFNSDGFLDLAVAVLGPNQNGDSSEVAILLGNGDGTFRPHKNFLVGQSAGSIAVGDFNKDDKLDLAVVNQTCPGGNCAPQGSVSILLGNGDGTFQKHVDYATGRIPTNVIAADMNGDGNADLLIPDQGTTTGSVSVLLGNGDGTFQTPVDYPTGSSPVGEAVGDFNGDGILDVVVADQVSNSISLFLGRGDGTRQPAVLYPSQTFPVWLNAGDFNHDGRLDFVVLNIANPAKFIVFLQNPLN
jgi:hypothetical protein